MLSNEEKLSKLEEKFLNDEISEKNYEEIRERLENSEQNALVQFGTTNEMIYGQIICNACGTIIKDDAFKCKECEDVYCQKCRVINPKGLILPICTNCGNDTLAPIYEEIARDEEQKLLEEQISNIKEYWCPECSKQINSYYRTSKYLDDVSGEEYRFCSNSCQDKYEQKSLCIECHSLLQTRYWNDDSMDYKFGKKLRFCTKECLREYRIEKICAQCRSKIYTSYYAEDIDLAYDEKKRFCSQNCCDVFRGRNLCDECGSIVGRYIYCTRCGDGQRYCCSSCFEEHEHRNDGFCFITTAVCISLGKPDDCTELNILRHYRDTWLKQHYPNEILEYYSIAPSIVKAISQINDNHIIWQEMLTEYIQPCIDSIISKRYWNAYKRYKVMVEELMKKYEYNCNTTKDV